MVRLQEQEVRLQEQEQEVRLQEQEQEVRLQEVRLQEQEAGLLPEQFRRWQERRGCCSVMAGREEELEQERKKLEEQLRGARERGEERSREQEAGLAREQESSIRAQGLAGQLLKEQRQVARELHIHQRHVTKTHEWIRNNVQ